MNTWIENERLLVWEAVVRLDRWLETNGWEGYDPYDVLGTPFFLFWQRSPVLPLRLFRPIVFEWQRAYPLLLRRMFRVKKEINAKGMGLFSAGYLNLYALTAEKRFKDKACECLNWLLAHSAPGYTGLGWGYPFDWQSKIFIPRGTPSSVVTSMVGQAFWQAYQLLGNHIYLETCERIGDFFVAHLRRDELDSETVCFSYTPLDNFHVHNANLLVAEFLCRVGQEIQKPEWVQLGERAARYALREQNSDGSLYYWGRIQNHYAPNHLDHYHSGFEIRALYGLWRTTGNNEYLQSARRYYAFYTAHLWERLVHPNLPKMTPSNLYPIDIHTCAEAILCPMTVAPHFQESWMLMPGVARWVIERMQTPEGWFIYMIDKRFGWEWRSDIPYLRWGQGWMLLALSQWLRAADDALLRTRSNPITETGSK